MDALDKLQIAESLDLVLEYAEGKLAEIKASQSTEDYQIKVPEEYDRYKEALTDVESVVLDYIGQLNNKQRRGKEEK